MHDILIGIAGAELILGILILISLLWVVFEVRMKKKKDKSDRTIAEVGGE
jgi:hypothetical protein